MDTNASYLALADMLRLLSRIWPQNNAAAADKRPPAPHDGPQVGPTLIEHLTSILGHQPRLKAEWPPEATVSIVSLSYGRPVLPHPLLHPPIKKLNQDAYQGGYMGYAFPSQKKLARNARESNVARPKTTFLNDAYWLYNQALSNQKAVFGDGHEHPLTASIIHSKGELMRARGRQDLAWPLFEQAIGMRRHILKNTHPALGDCLLGMAESLRVESKFAKAEPIVLKALELRTNAYPGGSHPSVAEAQCCLAMLYYSMGRYIEAQPIYEASLLMRERLCGPFHIVTAQSLNNLAGLLHTMGKFEEALPYYRRTLHIKRTALGDQHPDTASAKNNLGLLLKAMAQYDEAQTLYQQALATQEMFFGTNHQDVASSINNLAALHVALGDLQQGKNLYRKSLEIKKKVLGLEHPAVAATLNNLAGLCFTMGEQDDAKDYYEDSLRIRRAAFGDDHPSVSESLNNIGLLLYAQSKYADALPLFERSIAIKREAFGETHISTASSMHNMAIVLHKLKRYNEARDLYTQALDVRGEALGQGHPDYVSTQDNLRTLEMDIRFSVQQQQNNSPGALLGGRSGTGGFDDKKNFHFYGLTSSSSSQSKGPTSATKGASSQAISPFNAKAEQNDFLGEIGFGDDEEANPLDDEEEE